MVTDTSVQVEVEVVQKRKVVLKLEDVRSVYSGKKGKCMCGCAGTYWYAKKYQEESTVHRGYAVEDGECSDSAVRRIFRLITQDPAVKAEYGLGGEVIVHINRGERTYVAYMMEEGGRAS